MQAARELQRLRAVILQQKMQLQHCSRRLEAEVRDRTELERVSEGALGRLMNAMDERERHKRGHSSRVAAQTVYIGVLMGLDEGRLRVMHRGSLLHDIGKISVPESILLKEGALTVHESCVMREHVMIGIQIIGDLFAPGHGLAIPRCHHECFDGSGYPEGLRGSDIPLEARIFAVIDVYDALRTDRPYRDALSAEAAGEVIHALAGTQFDPAIVDVFAQVESNVWGQLARLVGPGTRYEDCLRLCRRLLAAYRPVCSLGDVNDDG